MKVQKIFVYGASGHGKVVGDILLACENPAFVGFIDDRADLRDTRVLGLPVFGDGQWLQKQARVTIVGVVLGVGDNTVRRKLAEKCIAWGAELISLVHPTAAISKSARLGRGTVVMAQAAINADAKIGNGAIVNTAAVVEHDVEIGDFAHVSPNSVMGGASSLGDLSQLCIGAMAVPCVTIGANTVVGAGSVVVRNIPDGVVAFGVPARVHRAIQISR
jgi:sugar O-acyltransferase (sialic acid O-acetyltransferase NeuD family)